MDNAVQFRVAELFAGVGGFRLGLQKAGWSTVWSNQWEPGEKAQHASRCYTSHFGEKGHVCGDISAIVGGPGLFEIPDHELLVGGFPCQDYSVAKPLSQAAGIQGKKGVLWWSIYDLLEHKRPPYVLLENVDRLLKSPANQRGRDFAIILSCLAQLGYVAEWRVVNAAEYGFPQRRRRVFLYAHRLDYCGFSWQPISRLYRTGVLAKALPVSKAGIAHELEKDGGPPVAPQITLAANPYVVSETFGLDQKTPRFENAGVMIEGRVWTRRVVARSRRPVRNLAAVVGSTGEVGEDFYVPPIQVEAWRYLKGAKSLPRVDKRTGHEYVYAEGGMVFPDPLDRPSRTILTGEGGTSASRFKHVVEDPTNGRLRRLVPEELEELNGFPRGWTATGMSDARRAFMMGNALVVDIVELVGRKIRDEAKVCLGERTPHDGEQTRADA